MKETIKAIKIEPGKRAKIVHVENELEALQKEVGGYLEAVTIADDMCVLCDEEGWWKNAKYNCCIDGVYYRGTVLVVGVDGEEFADIPFRSEMMMRIAQADKGSYKRMRFGEGVV